MGVGRKPQQASDYRSVTVLRDGGGDFPTIESAIEYLNGVGFTPTSSDFFVIELGAGTHTVDTATIGGPLVLPSFIGIQGESEVLTNIVGTDNTVALFEATNAYFQGLSFAECTYGVEQTANGSIYLRNCEANGIGATTGGLANIDIAGSFVFVQRCTSNFAGNGSIPFVNVSAGTAVAIENCNLIFHGAYCLEVSGGGDISFVGNTCFQCTGGTNITGNATQVTTRGNDYNTCGTGINIDGTGGSYRSPDDSVLNASVSDLVISNLNSTNYLFKNALLEPANCVLNGNSPPLNFVNSTDGSQTAAAQTQTITGATTLDLTYSNVLCNSTVDFTVTLPAASSYDQWVYTIKNINTNLVTVATTGGDTIDNEVTEIVGQYEAIKLVSNGTEWWVI